MSAAHYIECVLEYIIHQHSSRSQSPIISLGICNPSRKFLARQLSKYLLQPSSKVRKCPPPSSIFHLFHPKKQLDTSLGKNRK